MVKLHNVRENCVRILEEEKHRQIRMFVIFKKKVKETGIFIDKPKREKNSAYTREYCCCGRKKHFGDIIESNFA